MAHPSPQNKPLPLQEAVADTFYQARLLGTFAVTYRGEELTLPNTTSARNLLAHLLFYHQRPHPRLVLAGQFWPETTDSRARRALSQAIWQINQHLPGILQSDPNVICLSAQFPIRVDVAAFEALVEPHLVEKANDERMIAELSQATQYYQGDLLLDCYEEWVVAERSRLRETYLQVLERLITAFKATAHYEDGLQSALRLARHDPLRESAHREVMRLYHMLEKPEDALQQFETCRNTLLDELGIEPDAETLALAQTIARRASLTLPTRLPDTSATTVPSFLGDSSITQLPIIGRSAERSKLLRILDPLHRGVGGMILLEGEAGVGKTRLLQEVARDGEWHGAQVLWGKATEMEGGPIYAPLIEALSGGLSPHRCEQLQAMLQPLWLQVLQPFLPALVRELPEQPPLQPLEGTHGQDRLVKALAQLLTAWAQIKPLIVILEDLQWGGEDLLNILLQLTPALNEIGVFIIVSYRSEEMRARPALWEKMKSIPPTELRGRLALTILNAADTGKLIRTGLGTRKSQPQFEMRLHQETGGNPLFLLETLRSLHEDGQLSSDDGREWHPASDDISNPVYPLPQAVERVIERRLATLSPETRRLSNTLAILGSRFDFSLLATLEVVATPNLLAGIKELIHRHLLLETPHEYRFSHDKIGQVIYEGIAANECAWLHAYVAQKLEVPHPDWVEILAHHFTRGQVWPKALHYQKQAADKARQANAYRVEVEHLSAALQAAEQIAVSATEHFDLLAKREAALYILGDHLAQEIDLEAMQQLAINDPQRLGQVCQRQVLFLGNLNRFDEAEVKACEAVQLAKECDNPLAQASALINLGKSLQWRGKPEIAASYLHQAIAICQQQGDLHLEAKAHTELANELAYYQHHEARSEAQKALALYEQVKNPSGQAQILGTLGCILVEQGEVELARHYYEQALKISRAIGDRLEEARTLGNLANIFIATDQISIALEHFEQACIICHSIGNARGEHLIRMNIASIRANNLGENTIVRPAVEDSLAYYQDIGDPQGKAQCLCLLGAIALDCEQFDDAQAYLHESLSCSLNGNAWQTVNTYYYLIWLALRQNDPGMALEQLNIAKTLCQELSLSNMEVNLLGLRGMALLGLNQPYEALAATDEAMQRLNPGIEEASLVPYQHARVLLALGRTEEAHAAIEQSYQLLMQSMTGLTPEQRQSSLESVPNHRDVLAAWRAIQPRQSTLRLPRADAPTGRPLRDNEWVEVTWTPATPEDQDISDKVARRRQCLLRLLQEAAAQGATPAYEHLAEALQISQRTLAQDMAFLRQAHANLPPTRQAISHKV